MTRRSNSKTSRTRHSQEFKKEALELAEQVGVQEAAKQLGLHASQLYGYRSKAELLKTRGEVNDGLARDARAVPGDLDPVVVLARRRFGELGTEVVAMCALGASPTVRALLMLPSLRTPSASFAAGPTRSAWYRASPSMHCRMTRSFRRTVS